MKHIIKSLIVLGCFAVLQSCSKDFTNRPPEDQLTNAAFYKSEAEILAGTAPLYNIVWFEYNDKAALSFGDARGGNMVSNDRDAFYKFAVTATDINTLLPAYKAFYKIIGQSNTTMTSIAQNSTGVSEAAINRGIAECKFMRGMAYYFLVSNWGPVPIIYDNAGQLTDQNIFRNSQASVWKLIIKDLTYAAKNLPATVAQTGRLTKWSAEATLAKMYLTRAGLGSTGGTRNQSDLDSAKYYAADVVNNSGLDLNPVYANLFKSEYHASGIDNPESLFSLQWLPQKDVWGINNSFQAYMAVNGDVTGSWDGWGAAHGASCDLLKYYLAHPEDSLRRKATVMFNGDYYPEINKKGGGYNYTVNYVANFKKYIIGSVADNGGKGSEMAENIRTYMLRLAELYLVYAEAIMGNNASTADAEALKYFNKVRVRAGVPTKSSINFDDIMNEKRIETAFEGTYWYDILRLYYFNPTKAKALINAQDKGSYTLNYIAGTYTPRQYTAVYTSAFYPVTDAVMYFPIPEAESAKAPNLSSPPVDFDFSKLPD